MANDYSGTGAAGSNSFRLTADGGTVSGATSVAGNPDIVLVAGANITLTGTSPNQIKISSTGGGGGSGVTEVAAAGTVNGLTLTASPAPITGTGTITLGGTLAINNSDWSGTALSATNGGTGLTTYSTGDIIYASGANTLAKLAAGSNTHVLTLAGGVPTWAASTGTYTWIVKDGGGLTDTVNSGDTLEIAGGTGITTTLSGQGGTTPTLTIDATGGITGSGTAGQVTFWDGAASVTGDTGLTYNATAGSRQLKITDTGTDDMLVLESTATGAGDAPDMKFYRNSAVPVNNGKLGIIKFTAEESTTGTEQTYATITATSENTGSATLNGQMDFEVVLDTALVNMMTMQGQATGTNKGVTINPDRNNQTAFTVCSTNSLEAFTVNADSDRIGFGTFINKYAGASPTDGQLLIGSTAGPNIFKLGSLQSSDASITITPGGGTIDLVAVGGGDTVTITASAADILSVSSGAISGVDPGADRIVFWDDSAGKLTYLTAGTGLSISGTTITATGGGGLLPGGAEKDIQVYGAGDVFAGTSRFTYDDGSGGGTATMTVDEGNINVTDTKPSTGIGNVVATGVQNVLAGTKAAEAPLPDGSEILTIDQFGQTTILTGESYTLCEGSTDPTQVTGATATFIPINDGSAPIISVAIGGGGGLGGDVITDIIGGGAIGSGFTVAINEPFTVYILGNVVAQWGIDPGLWPGPGDGSCVAQIFGNVVVV